MPWRHLALPALPRLVAPPPASRVHLMPEGVEPSLPFAYVFSAGALVFRWPLDSILVLGAAAWVVRHALPLLGGIFVGTAESC